MMGRVGVPHIQAHSASSPGNRRHYACGTCPYAHMCTYARKRMYMHPLSPWSTGHGHQASFGFHRVRPVMDPGVLNWRHGWVGESYKNSVIKSWDPSGTRVVWVPPV